MVVFSQTNSESQLSYSIYSRKIRLYMTSSNLKNFSVFSFEIFRLIHCYSQILGVSPEPRRRSICPFISNKFHFYGYNLKTFYCNILRLS